MARSTSGWGMMPLLENPWASDRIDKKVKREGGIPFAAFWEEYPLKHGRLLAEQMWGRWLTNADREAAYAALKYYKQEDTVIKGYAHHADNYLIKRIFDRYKQRCAPINPPRPLAPISKRFVRGYETQLSRFYIFQAYTWGVD